MSDDNKEGAGVPVAECRDCHGTGVDGDCGPDGRAIDIECGACNGTGRTRDAWQVAIGRLERVFQKSVVGMVPAEYATGYTEALSHVRRALYATPPAVMPAAPSDAVRPCEYCDDTGDVHGLDGEWRGVCICPAGVALSQTMRPQAEPAAGQVTLTRAQVEELRAIIHNAESPLGNRLQDVSSRLYFALEGTGWTPAAGEQAGAVALGSMNAASLAKGIELCRKHGHEGDAATLEELRDALAAPGAAIAAREQEVDEATAMKGGRWVSADDIEHMTGELLSLATGDPYTPTKMVDAFHTLRTALAQPATVQRAEPAPASDTADAARWRFAMNWGTKDFAVCCRDENAWVPIKNNGPIDTAIEIAQTTALPGGNGEGES